MKHSKILGILLAAGTVAVSQMALADLTVNHGYACRLVTTSSPFNEISASYTGGKFVNASGATAWAICPVNFREGDSQYHIYLSSTATCHWCSTSAQTGTQTCVIDSTPTATDGGYYYAWNQNTGNIASEIQCRIPNGASVYAYYSY